MRRVLLREAFASSRVAQARPIIEAEATALVAQLTERLGTPVAARPVLRRSFTRFLLKWALSLEGEEVLKLEALVEEDRGLEIQFFEGQQVRIYTVTSFFLNLFFLILVRVSWKKCWKAWAILTNPVVTATDFLGSLSLPGVLDDLPRIRRERTRLLRSVLARRRTRCQKGDFLDALLEAQKKHGFGDDLIIETLVSLTTAGISTVATALEWLLLLLAQDRSAQERARNDGDFLDACILEALRLKTPLFIPRRCLEDIQVAGFKVKADSLLLPDSYKLAHDDTLWDSPKDFRPERFLGKERSFLTFKPGTQLPRCPFNRPSESGKFLPFGLGARFCPGAPLAMEQLRSFMEKLLTLQWRAENRTVDLSEAYSFTLTPANPARLIFALAEKWGIGVFASFKTAVSQLMCKKFMA